MENGKFKTWIVDGLYESNDLKYSFFDAAKGYTLIYGENAPEEADAVEVTRNLLDANERAWLMRCQRETIIGSFYDFSEEFLTALLDNFERELEIERQKNKKLDKKERRKLWKRAQKAKAKK